MVARLFRLRVALLAGEFRGSFGKGLRTTLLAVLLIFAALLLAYVPALLTAPGDDRSMIDLLIGGIVLAAVFIVPFFENRRVMDSRQFALFPVRSRSVAFSMLVTSVLTWPFLLLLFWLVMLGLLRPEWAQPGWFAPVALGIAAALAVCSARVTAAFSKLVAGERYAGAVRSVGFVLLVALLPVAVYAGTTVFRDDSTTAQQAAEILAWTPFGAPFGALGLVAGGDLDSALVHLAVAGGAVVLLAALWFALVAVTNHRIDRPISVGAARVGLGWFERFGAWPAQVIAARQLTYWARDPRYRVALFAIPVAPVVMLVAFWVAGADLRALALVPLPVMLLLLGWSQHNDVSMDSTAIWEHVASGIRGRADRAGRLAPVLLLGLPAAVIGSSITVTVLGEWRVLPAVVGMNVAVLLSACAVSSVFSVLMPYPTTRPGDSPFSQPQWSGSGSGSAQTLSMIFSIALAAVPVWFGLQAVLNVEFVENLWTLAFGVGYGLFVLLLGLLIGGWLFDRSGPELIAVTQVFD